MLDTTYMYQLQVENEHYSVHDWSNIISSSIYYYNSAQKLVRSQQIDGC